MRFQKRCKMCVFPVQAAGVSAHLYEVMGGVIKTHLCLIDMESPRSICLLLLRPDNDGFLSILRLLFCFSPRLPYTFVTKEVLEATCECLLEQAKKAEQTHQPQVEAERMILEEFGHCLMRIISSAGKAKSDCASINC